MNKPTLAIRAEDAPQRRQKSLYPEPFASQMAGRQKQVLGDVFGLKTLVLTAQPLRPMHSLLCFTAIKLKMSLFMFWLANWC
jgi:uncharacterized cupin superfamily protein